MGIVDKTTHKFSCAGCRATETVRVLEHGSSYGSSWDGPPETAKFSVTWERNEFGEPRAKTIKCTACGADGTDQIS
jgi:hypothetical protein